MDASSKTTTPAIRACYRVSPAGPGCDEATVITALAEKAPNTLPSYIERAGNVVTVKSTLANQAKSYTMLVTHSTTFEVAPITFDTLTIVINVCVITAVDLPTNPGTKTYLIHSLTDIDLDLASPGFVQRPACGYSLTEVITWSFNPTPALPTTQTGGQPYKLKIKSSTNAHAATYVAKLTNNVTYASQSFQPFLTFSIVVTDPCITTVIAPFTIGTVAGGASHGVLT